MVGPAAGAIAVGAVKRIMTKTKDAFLVCKELLHRAISWLVCFAGRVSMQTVGEIGGHCAVGIA